jgi:uncharacterized protein DUF4154
MGDKVIWVESIRRAARDLQRSRLRSACCVRILALCCAVFASLISNTQSQDLKPTEYQVKAAYLYNFGKFVRWPASASGASVFTICLLGNDPFSGVLESTVAGESISGKPLVLRRIARADQSAGCQILYISSSEDAHLKRILSTLPPQGILTVSDMPEFTERGGMMQFVMQGERVRFQVNLVAAQRAGLNMSSELLKVATAVNRGGAGQ